MNTIIDIVNQLPSIMLYFVEGYIFITIYKFITAKDKEVDTQHILLKSVVASFVLRSAFDFVLTLFSIKMPVDNFYILTLCVLSALVGYIFAKLVSSQWFSSVLFSIGIQRTPNKRIWDDVIKDKQNCWVCLQSRRKDNVKYLGMCRYIEEYEREPIIALSYYQIVDNEGNVVADYSDTDNVLMINTKDFERADIFYDEQFGTVANIKNIPAKFFSKFFKKSNKNDKTTQE